MWPIYKTLPRPFHSSSLHRDLWMSFCDYWFTIAFESQSAILLAVSEAVELVSGLTECGASKKSPCYRQVHDKMELRKVNTNKWLLYLFGGVYSSLILWKLLVKHQLTHMLFFFFFVKSSEPFGEDCLNSFCCSSSLCLDPTFHEFQEVSTYPQ